MEQTVGLYDYDYFNTSSSSQPTNDENEEAIQKLPAFRSGRLHFEQILTCHRIKVVLQVLEGILTKIIYFNNSSGVTTIKGKLKAFRLIKIKIELTEIGPATLLTIKKVKGENTIFQDVFLTLSKILSLPVQLTSHVYV